MFDISIIIFTVSLLAIVILFAVQAGRIGDREYPSKDLSYENFYKLRRRTYEFFQFVIHSLAIILSKSWARVTHFISSIFHKGVKRIDRELQKHEKRSAEGIAKQSVFITTVKAYKHELKKLKGKVEEELPRPRTENPRKQEVDFKQPESNIEEPLEEIPNEDESK